MTDSLTELDTIAGAMGRTIVVRGDALTITPLRVREIGAFARSVAPLAPLITPDLLAAPGPATVLPLLANGADALIAATACGARLPADQVGEWLADELLEVAVAVLVVNADFFTRRLAPALERAAGQVTTALTSAPGAGPTPASASSAPATATPT